MRRIFNPNLACLLVIIVGLAMVISFNAEARPFFGFPSSSGSAPVSSQPSQEEAQTSADDGYSPTADTYVDERRSNNKYGQQTTIRLKDRNLQNRAGLVKFDISDIPLGSQVTSAKLLLYVSSKSSSNKSVSVYAAMGSWSESTSWNNRPTVASSAEDAVTIAQTRKYYELDITDLVQDWVDGVEANNGIYIIAGGGDVSINSRENKTGKPKLIIEAAESQNPPADDTPIADNPPPSGGVADSGVSDAPLEPMNKRVLIVAKDGSGDYSSIQVALNNSRSGDTIQVKDGVYVERVNFTRSGTREEPIAVVNYPNHSPVIDPGGGTYPAECCPSSGTPRVEFNAEWIILEGFEIRYGWNGVKLYKGHNTIRDNWIHHNRYHGILVVSTGDVFIDGNTIEDNGTDPGACYKSEWGGESPKHCHGIYMSDFFCTGMSDITIRGNVLSDHGGRGVQWNGIECSSKMQNTLVENNIIENNSWGIVLWSNVNDSVIRNNTFVMEKYPFTDDNSHTFVGILNSVNNIFKNNIFYSTRGDVAALETFDSASGQNTFDYNLWKVGTNSWKWEDSWRSDFNSNYKSVTGWDGNGLFNANPGFYNVSNGIYHLNANSSARDRGENNVCAAIDYDRQDRTQDPICDIGMDEYFN